MGRSTLVTTIGDNHARHPIATNVHSDWHGTVDQVKASIDELLPVAERLKNAQPGTIRVDNIWRQMDFSGQAPLAILSRTAEHNPPRQSGDEYMRYNHENDHWFWLSNMQPFVDFLFFVQFSDAPGDNGKSILSHFVPDLSSHDLPELRYRDKPRKSVETRSVSYLRKDAPSTANKAAPTHHG